MFCALNTTNTWEHAVAGNESTLRQGWGKFANHSTPFVDHFTFTSFKTLAILFLILSLTLRSHGDRADGGVFGGSRESSQSNPTSGRGTSLHRVHTQSPLQEYEKKTSAQLDMRWRKPQQGETGESLT